MILDQQPLAIMVPMLFFLPISFAAVACLYAMAGFGGGSTYIALLAISGLPLAVVPVIALSCNLLVSSQGSWLLARRGHARWTILGPLLAGSIPSAFIGGAWRLPQEAFLWILATALTMAGFAMLAQNMMNQTARMSHQSSAASPDAGAGAELKPPPIPLLAIAGISLGLLAGLTGIGGGIYLAPVMHLFGWAKPHTIATCTSLFIALNSLAGLIGQLTKGAAIFDSVPTWLLVACPVAVLIGGRIGSFFLTERLPKSRVIVVTSFVILLVAARLWVKVFST